MFHLFTPPAWRNSPPPRRRRQPLCLELLEKRDCPTALSDNPPRVQDVTLTVTPVADTTVELTGHVTAADPSTVLLTFSGVVGSSAAPDNSGNYDVMCQASALGEVDAFAQDEVDYSSATASADVTSSPPSVQDLSIAYDTGTTVTLSGQVTDESPGSTVVNFSGAASGSVSPGTDGSFSVVLPNAALGSIEAVATDVWGLTSSADSVDVTSAPPSIQGLTVSYGAGTTVTVSGQVIDADPADAGVNLSGVVSGSVNPDAAGNFSLTEAASGLGTVTAEATNVWGLTSAPASVDVTSVAPSIQGLTVSYVVGTTVTISGQVIDADPGSATVNLSGVVSGSVGPDASGNFALTEAASGLGTVTAEATNAWGLTSTPASVDVASADPSIQGLTVSYGVGTTVTVSGQVIDADPADAVVNLSGVVSGSVNPDADGNFALTETASGLGTVTVEATNVWGLTSAPASVDVTSADPFIQNLAISYGAGTTVCLSGDVIDESPGTATVNFSGVVSGSVAVNADGSFSLDTDASGLGTVNLVATDAWGLTSATASVAVVSAPPSIQDLAISYGSGQTVTVSGMVIDDDPASAVVNFSGVASGSVIPNADGSFSVVLTASALGNIDAVATNVWGLSSSAAAVAVTNNPPIISSFTAVQENGNNWVFSGTVTDESPAGLTVQLGGLPSLSGETATVNSDGTFAVTCCLASGEQGWASAQVTDWWGAQSVQEFADVSLS